MLRRRLLPAATRMAAAAVPGGAGAAVAVTPSPLATSAAVLGLANAVGFAISAYSSSHLHLDLIGTGAFALTALATWGGEARQRASAVGMAIWATKLSSFLFYRALEVKHDARLTSTLSTTSGAFGFWAISFVWGWVVSLPHTIAAGVPLAGRPRFGQPADVAGIALFALGLFVESLADYQKWRFKHEAANRGHFCDVGVWQISQHPNWLGNWLLWCGMCLLNAPTLLADSPAGAGWLRRYGRLAAAAASPVFLLALFYAQATDTLANTAELARNKYGHQTRFQQYEASTPLVLPTPKSLARLFA